MLAAFVTGYIVIAPVALLLVAGWDFAYFSGRFPTLAHSHRRQWLGEAIAYGALCAPFWPATVPLVFCMSGFAEHGWRLR